jgi:L-lactate dehydrogenase complex protein LldF
MKLAPTTPEIRAKISRTISAYTAAVARGKNKFLDWENARARAAAIKFDALNHLDRYLVEFEQNVLRNGGKVFWAETAEDARRYIVELARARRVRKIVKSKSMTTEEIHLNAALETAGIAAVETDLGEYIVQLRNEPPYHIVTPAMHLDRHDISATFSQKLGAPRTENAEELTKIARETLRADFQSAEMGVTGANFAIAETGQIAITENEGNARLTFSLPKIHVAVVGIEKILPKLEHLALFWPLLATSGTGQHLTAYNSLIGGGDDFHVVLLDNGRTKLLADAEQRDALHCIRCGACLNACPIFRTVGGHAYGTTYQGPIGSVITPHLRGLREWGHLPYASSLCGACTGVCPVKIELHHHLLHNRRNFVAQKLSNPLEKLAMRAFCWAMSSPARYRFAQTFLRIGAAKIFARAWTKTREFPVPARETFKDWWQKNGK